MLLIFHSHLLFASQLWTVFACCCCCWRYLFSVSQLTSCLHSMFIFESFRMENKLKVQFTMGLKTEWLPIPFQMSVSFGLGTPETSKKNVSLENGWQKKNNNATVISDYNTPISFIWSSINFYELIFFVVAISSVSRLLFLSFPL